MRVSIAGVVATAILGVSASSASAADVWMWECHGPSGQALTDKHTAYGITNSGSYTNLAAGGCGTTSVDAGVRLTAPGADSSASATVTLPDGLNVKRVKIVSRANGLDAAGAATYSATYGGNPVAAADLAASEFAVSGSAPLTLKLSCTAACTGSLDILGIAFLVSDTDAPFATGVSRNNPVVTSRDIDPRTGELYVKEVPLVLSGKDTGTGLDRAVVSIFGPGMAMPSNETVKFKDVAGKTCTDLSPGNEVSNDRPLDRELCRLDVPGVGVDPISGKPLPGFTGTTTAWRDLIPLAAGGSDTYYRWVTFYDAAGNATPALNGEPFTAEVIARPIDTRELSIGTDPVSIPNQNPGTNTPGGGVGGAQSTQCRTPRLSVILSSKPVRVTKGTPVLKYKKAYKFTGRLTCVIDGKRRSAPKRTKVSILNKVGKKTVRKPNTAIRDKGAVNVKLAFISNRTVIFRYTNAAGQKSEVKIKVRVTKKTK